MQKQYFQKQLFNSQQLIEPGQQPALVSNLSLYSTKSEKEHKMAKSQSDSRVSRATVKKRIFEQVKEIVFWQPNPTDYGVQFEKNNSNISEKQLSSEGEESNLSIQVQQETQDNQFEPLLTMTKRISAISTKDLQLPTSVTPFIGMIVVLILYMLFKIIK